MAEASALGKRIGKRWDDLRTAQANFRNLWRDVDRFAIPFRKNSQSLDETPGERKTRHIFDGTTPWALTVAASAIHGTMMPNSVRWFTPEVDSEPIMDSKENQVWFEDSGIRMMNAMNKSNLNSEGNEMFIDLLGYGTGVLDIAEKTTGGFGDEFRGLKFKAYQPSVCAISENEDGIADTVFRQTEATVDQLVREFTINRVSDKVRNKWAKDNLDDVIKIVHATHPRMDIDLSRITASTPSMRLPFASVWMEQESKHILRESGTFTPRYAVPRWFKASNEMYGRSPVLNNMPDIRSLNRVVQLELEALGLVVHPPLLLQDRGIVGNLRMIPNGFNYVRDKEAIVPFVSGARFDVTNLEKTVLQQTILRALYIDQIQLPPIQGTPLSATEVAARFETMQRIIGPTFGRVQTEFMDVLLTRVFWIMFQRGALAEPPADLAELLARRPGMLRFRFDGPLARAQQATEVEAIQRALALLSPFVEIFPEMLDPINAEKTGRFVLEALRVPASVIDSEAETEAKREGRIQQGQQEQAAEEVLAATRGLKDITPFLEELRVNGLAA